MHETTHIPGSPDTTGRSSPWDDYRTVIQEHAERRTYTTARSVRDRNEALRAVGEVVYAVRCGDVIKIGHTGDLAARCWSLKTTDVLAFTPGTYEDEQSIHALLVGNLHHGREWYYPTPDVLAVVNEMRDRIGLAPVA